MSVRNCCYKCTKRHINCHSECKDYVEFCEWNKMMNKKKKEYDGYQREANECWSYTRSRKREN